MNATVARWAISGNTISIFLTEEKQHNLGWKTGGGISPCYFWHLLTSSSVLLDTLPLLPFVLVFIVFVPVGFVIFVTLKPSLSLTSLSSFRFICLHCVCLPCIRLHYLDLSSLCFCWFSLLLLSLSSYSLSLSLYLCVHLASFLLSYSLFVIHLRCGITSKQKKLKVVFWKREEPSKY